MTEPPFEEGKWWVIERFPPSDAWKSYPYDESKGGPTFVTIDDPSFDHRRWLVRTPKLVIVANPLRLNVAEYIYIHESLLDERT